MKNISLPKSPLNHLYLIKTKKMSPKSKTERSNIFIYSEDKIISTVTKLQNLQKKKKALKKYHIRNGTSYLAWSSEHELEMITKIQHQTALWRSAISLFQPKIIKPKNTESNWSKVSWWMESVCVYMAPGCASAANCHPLLSWVSVCVFFLFHPDAWKLQHPCFSTTEGQWRTSRMENMPHSRKM